MSPQTSEKAHPVRILPAICIGGALSAALALIASFFLQGQTPLLPNIHDTLSASTISEEVSIEEKPILKQRFSKEDRELFAADREELLRHTLTLRLPPELSSLEKNSWKIPLAEHSDWIPDQPGRYGIHATISERALRKFLTEEVIPSLPAPSHLQITELPEEGSTRATVEGEISDGWELDPATAARTIVSSVASGLVSIQLPVQEVKGEIENDTIVRLGDLQLLARGRSDFTESVPNRIYNIEKAFNEHMTNVLIPPGDTFSFAALFPEKILQSTGWKLSMGIFSNGEELQPTAGGGICQTSTTLYRAALLAGLPIEEQHNHSMYIKYYRKYGEGLDATFFEDSKDFTFINDTPDFLFLQAYTVGTEAYVDIYGTDDGREVALEGPYRWYDAPEDVRHPEGRYAMGENDIGWRRIITHASGEEETNILLSRYNTEIPESAPEHAGTLTASGPLPSSHTPHSPQQPAT